MSAPVLSVIEQISAAMSAGNLEHQVIASNIANRDTQGYQRLQVRFEQAMDRAGRATVSAAGGDTAVSLEQDLVAMSANSLHYQALSRALSRYFSVVAQITNPNRG